MILELVSSDSPFLRQQTASFEFANPPIDPIQLAKDLYETLIAKKGLGLAAPQVGLPYRAFSMYAVPGIVCFNPRVIDQSREEISLEEGSLSFPNLIVKIKRPRRIKVRYSEPNGNTVTKTLDGMTARVFLHQLDHLDGVLFFSRAHKLHLSQAERNRTRLQRMENK